MSGYTNLLANYTPLKRTLLHIIFWFVILFMQYLTYLRIDEKSSWILFLKDSITVVSMFYIADKVIIPKWLMNGKFLPCILFFFTYYILWAEATIFASYLTQRLLNPIKRLDMYLQMMIDAGVLGPLNPLTLNLYLFDFIFLVSLPLGMKVMQAFVNVRSSKIELELENTKLNLSNSELQLDNLKLELGFLKSQLNPHFLFNTLNSIQVLISEADVRAEKSLQQLSGIMYYLLHGSSKAVVTIEEEYGFLKDYIMLEKLRLREDFPLAVELQADQEGYLIAPLVIFTFVENAFKHGLSVNDKATWINIHVSVRKGVLNMKVSNSSYPTTKPDHYVGGIGLENVKKRLELNYTNAYQLDITDEIGSYEVQLNVDLNTVVTSGFKKESPSERIPS